MGPQWWREMSPLRRFFLVLIVLFAVALVATAKFGQSIRDLFAIPTDRDLQPR